MPKKKEGMLIELLPRPTKGEDGQPLLYARPAIGFKYSTRAVDDFCQKYRGMSAGDLTRLFETFLDVASWLMSDGSRVETPIGSFVVRLKLDGDYTDPKKVQSKNVRFGGIEFIPAKRFEMTAEERILHGYRQKEEVVERHPIDDPEGRLEALRKSLIHGYTTAKRFSYFCGLRQDTARKYLDSLCKGDEALLQRYKEGRTNHYVFIKK